MDSIFGDNCLSFLIFIVSQEHMFKLSSLIHNRKKIVSGLNGFYSILNVQLLKNPTFCPEIRSVSCNLLFIKLKHISNVKQ